MFPRVIKATWTLAICVVLPAGAAGQGLIWNLPKDGTAVVYGGTMTQSGTSPDGKELKMTWDQQLVIRSVGQEQVTVDGESVPARWIEFEVTTGQRTEQGIDAGPVGKRIYRVLAVEKNISGVPDDEGGAPNTFLRIVKGFEKLGAQPPRELTSEAFETYPAIAQLMNYKPNEIKAVGEQPVSVPAGQFKATKYSASATSESPSVREENKATILASPEMPFGLIRWNVAIKRLKKDPDQTREEFALANTITAEMEARAIRTGARSSLPAGG